MSEISKIVNEILQLRKENIKPQFDRLWEKSVPYIDIAYKLSELTRTKGWELLLSSNPEFKKIWEKDSSKVTEFVDYVKSQIGQLKFEGDQKRYSISDTYDAVKSKVNKDEVEICVMGPVSSGKSVLMQGLTGAPQYVLPAGTGKTTAARTTFRNSKAKKAKVFFLTKEEFRSIFNNYIFNLNIALKANGYEEMSCWSSGELSDFCDKLKNSDSFKDTCYKNSEVPGLNTLILQKDYFKTFKELYVDRCADYEGDLDRKPEPLNEEDIINGRLVPYVSYKNNVNDKTVTSCLALAVKEVIVDWPLQTSDNQDLGKISLVDTMGIGEPKFSVEEDLLNIIKQRADLAIALCKIENASDDFESKHDNDKKFVTVLSKLRDRSPQSWIYYLANKHAGCKMDENDERTFKLALWDFMNSGAEGFSLNSERWDSLEFILSKDGKESVNSKAIVTYFVNRVLSNLRTDIINIDKHFMKMALSAYETAETKFYSLKNVFKALDMVSVDVTDEDSMIDEAAERIMESVIHALSDLHKDIAKNNKKLCDKIMDKIYPLLCTPEIYNIFNIELPEKNLFLDWDSTNQNKTSETISKLKDTNFREFLIFVILSELNKYRNNPETRYAPYTDVKEYVLKEVEKNEKWCQDKDCFELLMKQDFFEKLYVSTSIAISEFLPEVRSKAGISVHDPNQKEKYENSVGRELQAFYTKREEILHGILARLDTTANAQIQSELAQFFATETKKVKENVCAAIHSVLVENKIDSKTNHANKQQWLVDYSSLSKGKKLQVAVNEFLNQEVDLNEIVTQQQSDTLLRNLCRVDLSYRNLEDAAYSFFTSLFIIDRHIRFTLWQMYVKTFKDYGIYSPILDLFFNKVFCMKNLPTDSKSSEYYEFKNLIKMAKKESFATSDDGKIAKAKMAFDDLYNLINKN